jgi:tetratricopeptide (TPR) repeat protein
MYSAVVLASSGDRRLSAVLTERGDVLSRQSNQITTRGVFILLKAFCHLIAAEYPDAARLAQEAIEYASKNSQSLQMYFGLDVMAWAQSYLGLHEQAIRARAQAAEVRKTLRRTLMEDWFEAEETEILLQAGKIQEALAKAQAVAAVSKASGLLSSYAIAERVWGTALHRLGSNLAEVEAHLALSLDVCNHSAQVSNAFLGELWWGRIHRERGNRMSAQQHFDKAFKMLEAGGYDRGLEWARRFASE